MTAAHSEGWCWCPACIAGAGLRLLAGGRPDMAARLLDDLPGRIAAALDEAYERGRKAGTRAKPPREAPAGGSRPGFRRTADELRDHVERLGAARVAELLGLRMIDLAGLLEGRAGISRTALARLRKAAEERAS